MEVVDLAAAHRINEALDQAPVEATHQVRVSLGQLPEGAVGEGDHGALAVVGAATAGSKPKLSSRRPAPRGRTRRGRGRMASSSALLPADFGGLVGRDPGDRGQADQHPGQQRERRRLQAERGGLGPRE